MFIHNHLEVPYISYLDKTGMAVADLPDWVFNTETLKEYYQAMVWAREADRKAVALQRTGKLGTYPSCLGQEAISVVYASLMKADDVLVPYYRDMPGQLLRGVSLTDVLLYWGGDERGSAGEGYGKDFPNCVPIATQAGHAVGVATAFRVNGEHRAVVTTCGDGATSKGDFLEALNLAGVWQLPVVFIVNNNRWAISVPRNIQCGAETLAQKGVGAGLPCVQVDGNDVVALHEVISSALERAHSGKGATIIEAITYRLCDHTTADDASRYRSEDELNSAWEEEPVRRLQQFLFQQGSWSPEQEQDLQRKAAEGIRKAVDKYLQTPMPPLADLFDYHYANMPHQLRQQKEELQGVVSQRTDNQGGLNHE